MAQLCRGTYYFFCHENSVASRNSRNFENQMQPNKLNVESNYNIDIALMAAYYISKIQSTSNSLLFTRLDRLICDGHQKMLKYYSKIKITPELKIKQFIF